MVAALVLLNPGLTTNALFHFPHTLEFIDDFSIILLVHSLRPELNAFLSVMEINSTFEAVALFAPGTVKLVIVGVFNEGEATTRCRTPI